MSAIDEKYASLGGSTGPLGSPLALEAAAPDGYGSYRTYAHGSIFASPAAGAHALFTAVRDAYLTAGGVTSGLGYPLTDDAAEPDGAGQFALFQFGAIHVRPDGTQVQRARSGTAIHAHAIPVNASAGKGVHLQFLGSPAWIYSARGFWIQRRPFTQKTPELKACASLDSAGIAAARAAGSAALSLGTVLVRAGSWPYAPADKPKACDVFTLELNAPQDIVGVTVSPPVATTTVFTADAFIFGIRRGKVCAGPIHASQAVLRAPGIDSVVVYAIGEAAIRFCERDDATRASDEASWLQVPYLMSGLQLPLKELDPAIGDEYATASARIAPDVLDKEGFYRLADQLRAGLPAATRPRPAEIIAQLRDGSDGLPREEMATLDVLKIALVHPTWRRALGLAHFDHDPSLTAGASYEYRITGFFPAEDLDDAIFDFHTLPSETQAPTEFYLGALRVRVPEPRRVQYEKGEDVAQGTIGRRGLMLSPWKGGFLPFGINVDFLDGAVAVIDFPAPVTRICVEVGEDSTLAYSTSLGSGAPSAQLPLPGSKAVLQFASPIDQLRLYGSGSLLQVRILASNRGLVAASTCLPPVALVDSPLLPPPPSAWLLNLQQPPAAPGDGTPPDVLATRHKLGFEVRWAPPPVADVWPAEETAAPPLEATLFQLQHQNLDAGTDWENVVDGDNWIFGTRTAPPTPAALRPGVDLLSIYPEERVPVPAPFLSWKDAFSVDLPGRPAPRPTPPPNTKHRYRIRSVDAIGRPSATWTTTAPLLLEKHVPPPLPAAWDGSWAFDPADPTRHADTGPRPTGVFAKVLQAGSEELAGELATATDLTLGERNRLESMTGNAVIVRWGWHADQVELDPYARQFRIYTSPPLDSARGQLVSYDAIPGGWRLHLSLERAIDAEAGRGLYLEAGYAFLVTTHTGGTSITADVSVAVPNRDGSLPTPRLGAVELPLRFSPKMTRPAAWSARVATVPITPGIEQYHCVLFDALNLSSAHPRDQIWVGVSTADDQPYVADERAALDPAHALPGNESALTVLPCAARYQGKPTLVDVAPLADVPVQVTAEPTGRPVRTTLDLGARLPAGMLTAGELVLPERAQAGDVIGAYRVSDDRTQLFAVTPARLEGEVEAQSVPGFSGLAAADQQGVLDGLTGLDAEALSDRHLVWLAAAHPFAERLFKRAVPQPMPLAPFDESLPPVGGRYVYRLRRANGAGQLSDGAAYARFALRVPSLQPGAPPEKESVTDGVSGPVLRFRSHASATHLLWFSRAFTGAPPTDLGELVRVPNRPDLFPSRVNQLVLMRTRDGLLQPSVKSLRDPDVTQSSDGYCHVNIPVAGPGGADVQVWACSLSRDGIPSRLVGPFRLAIPVAR